MRTKTADGIPNQYQLPGYMHDSQRYAWPERRFEQVDDRRNIENELEMKHCGSFPARSLVRSSPGQVSWGDDCERVDAGPTLERHVLIHIILLWAHGIAINKDCRISAWQEVMIDLRAQGILATLVEGRVQVQM
nr:hypothetical protein CFP56_04180 [Quercus suber]